MMAKVIRGLKELLPYAGSNSIGIPCSKMLQSMLTLSMPHVTIVLLSHLVEKVPSLELSSAQSLA